MTFKHLNPNDLETIINLIDVALTRGAIRGNEIVNIANLRTNVTNEIQNFISIQQEEATKAQERAEQEREAQLKLDEERKFLEKQKLADERQLRVSLENKVKELQSLLTAQQQNTTVQPAIESVVEPTPAPTQPVDGGSDEPKELSKAMQMARAMNPVNGPEIRKTNVGIKGCFIHGTMITMADGSEQKIEDVVVGDSVLTYNFSTDSTEANEVLSVSTPVVNTLGEINFGDDEQLLIGSIDHPYWSVNKNDWVSINPSETSTNYGMTVQQIAPGDTLLQVDGTTVSVNMYRSLDMPDDWQLYNLTSVANNTNFFANGVLVHNKGEKQEELLKGPEEDLKAEFEKTLVEEEEAEVWEEQTVTLKTEEEVVAEAVEEFEEIVIPDEKDLNRMTKLEIAERANELGFNVILNQTKVQMIEQFLQQSSELIEEIKAEHEVVSEKDKQDGGYF